MNILLPKVGYWLNKEYGIAEAYNIYHYYCQYDTLLQDNILGKGSKKECWFYFSKALYLYKGKSNAKETCFKLIEIFNICHGNHTLFAA